MRWFAPYAWLPGGLAQDVLLVTEGEVFWSVAPGGDPSGATWLPGIVLPGFANCHSHAFHRALRGRTHDRGGTFWTWRERMYTVASQLDPSKYRALARAVYAEMALAGVTSVGEFHYLHHDVGGRLFADPNAMGDALRAAAVEAGIRLTLLDTCYLSGGLNAGGHLPLNETQRRFGDADVSAWADRVAQLTESPGMRIGAALHSVRAVPASAFPEIVRVAGGRPLHAHLSEQPAENEACAAFYGCTPTELLAQHGALGAATTAVHATHLTARDVSLLGGAGSTACFCPTTERDLADGIGPSSALAAAGVRLSLGSDQHAVVDLIEDARALEMDERLATRRRGNFRPDELLAALTAHDSIGWPETGRLAAGARADLVAVRLDSVRTAGIDPGQVLLAATAADVDTVIVDGRTIVSGGRHRLGDVGASLRASIEPLWTRR
ncbi:MAG: formimidoylglutamate deiminase [Actinomycetota bacterium]|nr:formimidoylglutamate deiminase [Actinomycetota bacterium]